MGGFAVTDIRASNDFNMTPHEMLKQPSAHEDPPIALDQTPSLAPYNKKTQVQADKKQCVESVNELVKKVQGTEEARLKALEIENAKIDAVHDYGVPESQLDCDDDEDESDINDVQFP